MDVRIISSEIKNIKNVAYGKIAYMNDSAVRYRAKIENNDIVGIYGQNGSGKTALVEALAMLKSILTGIPISYNEYSGLLSEEGENFLNTVFFIQDADDKYLVEYEVLLKSDNKYKKINIDKEYLRYWRRGSTWKTKREIEFSNPYYDKKKLFSNIKAELKVSNNKLKNTKFADIVQNASIHCADDGLSIFFNSGAIDLYLNNKSKLSLEETIFSKIIISLSEFGKGYFQVVKVGQLADVIKGDIVPLNVHEESNKTIIHGCLPLFIDGIAKMPEAVFDKISGITKSINIAIASIIPDLKIELKVSEKIVDKDGINILMVEAYSVRGNRKFSTRYESEGIKRIISLMSCLIAVYNIQGFCLVVDELDAGIFEYMLGELLGVMNDEAKGQLIFTSHNLRVFEKLGSKNIVCTTTNAYNRYIRLTGVEKNNNFRDFYLRDILLGGQEEELYDDSSLMSIGYAFRKAANIDGGDVIA